MNRRNFLRILAGAAAAPAVTYFLPPIGGWRSDVHDLIKLYRSNWLSERVQRENEAMVRENLYIFHPARQKAVESLMFNGIIWSSPPSDPESFDFAPLTYGGIKRAPVKPINQRMNEACGAEWTDKQWS